MKPRWGNVAIVVANGGCTAEADALLQQELVSEGLATAWVQGGQVVLRKAANPEYGVELGGGTKSDRLQGSGGGVRQRPVPAQCVA